jgi:hypothetical protein
LRNTSLTDPKDAAPRILIFSYLLVLKFFEFYSFKKPSSYMTLAVKDRVKEQNLYIKKITWPSLEIHLNDSA